MDVSYLQREQFNRVRTAFAEGAALPESLLPGALARSWERSRSAGLDPWRALDYKVLPPPGNPRKHPGDRRLARCVGAEVEQLWTTFGGRDWAVCCLNLDGMIIHQRQHPDGALPLIRNGRHLQEVDFGTTAPGCVLAEGRWILVRGNQHYLSEFDRIFCLSVPLHGLAGEMIGALDITGFGERDPALLLKYFRQAASIVENRLIAELRDCRLLRLRYDPRWGQCPPDGLLAIDGEGFLRAANRLARRLLNLPGTGVAPRLHVHELFAGARPAQRRRLLKSTAPQCVMLADGTNAFVDLVRDARGTRPTPVQKPTSSQSGLREQTLRTVAEALHSHSGNISATARTLGISRTTLYKKIRALYPSLPKIHSR